MISSFKLILFVVKQDTHTFNDKIHKVEDTYVMTAGDAFSPISVRYWAN